MERATSELRSLRPPCCACTRGRRGQAVGPAVRGPRDGAREIIYDTKTNRTWTSGPRLLPVCRLIALSFSLTSTDKYSRTVRHCHSGPVRCVYAHGHSLDVVRRRAGVSPWVRSRRTDIHRAVADPRLTSFGSLVERQWKGSPTETSPHSKSKAATIVQVLMQVQGRACSPGNQGALRLSRPDVTKPRPSPRPHRATDRRRPPHPPHLPCPRQGPCRQAYPSCLRGPRAGT